MRAKTLGIIFAHEKLDALRELTATRTTATLPFGARYRLIDFTLSSMVASGIRTVGVVPQNNFYSLTEHLGTGKEWDLNRKRGGLSILPPIFAENDRNFFQNSKIARLRGIMEYINKCECEYVIFSDSNIVANIDYSKLLDAHINSRAYMTALYKSNVSDKESFKAAPFVEVDDEGRITDVTINQEIALHNKMLLGVYVIEKQLLEFLIHQCVAHNKFDLERDVIQEMATSLDIRGFEHMGYASKINSAASFFNANLELLKNEVRTELFATEQKIITKVHDERPSFFGTASKIKNSILADGCSIEGTVENSVIFRNVKIAKGARVKNCILMQGCEIGEDSELSYSIIDSHSRISSGSTLHGAKEYPIILPIGYKI